jgi:hypothetical protein
MAPPIPVDKIGPVDLVLLSHAQHLDNLDNEGRRLLANVGTTITTPASAAMKLPGRNVKGLATWQSTEVTNAAGERLKITGMPGVHTSNPDLRETIGEVMGFMLEWDGQQGGAFYISGDTVWIDDIFRDREAVHGECGHPAPGCRQCSGCGRQHPHDELGRRRADGQGARPEACLPRPLRRVEALQRGELVDRARVREGGSDAVFGAAPAGRIAERCSLD